MSEFASRTPRDLNHDPMSWVARPQFRPEIGVSNHHVGSVECATWCVKEPRPEFDHVQHNEPNPILVAFRSGKYPAGYWAHRLAKGDLPVAVDKASTNEIDHARRVLSRLARLVEVAS